MNATAAKTLIRLSDEYSFVAIFDSPHGNRLVIPFCIGETDGGKDSLGWHPGQWEQLKSGMKPVAAVNQYGEVTWPKGERASSKTKDDYAAVALAIAPEVRLWDERVYVKYESSRRIFDGSKILAAKYIRPLLLIPSGSYWFSPDNDVCLGKEVREIYGLPIPEEGVTRCYITELSVNITQWDDSPEFEHDAIATIKGQRYRAGVWFCSELNSDHKPVLRLYEQIE